MVLVMLLVCELLYSWRTVDSLGSESDSCFAMVQDGGTPLMLASEQGHDEVVAMLLGAGVKKDAADEVRRRGAG